ncbi:hypothetical protein QQ045_005096 [Rhodiola kirilowii]
MWIIIYNLLGKTYLCLKSLDPFMLPYKEIYSKKEMNLRVKSQIGKRSRRKKDHNVVAAVGIISDGGSIENGDALALVVLHAPTNQHKVVEHKVVEQTLEQSDPSMTSAGQSDNDNENIPVSGNKENEAVDIAQSGNNENKVDSNVPEGSDDNASTEEHNEDTQNSELQISKESARKIASYGSDLFYCEELGGPVDARAFFTLCKTGGKDDQHIFQTLDEANETRQGSIAEEPPDFVIRANNSEKSFGMNFCNQVVCRAPEGPLHCQDNASVGRDEARNSKLPGLETDQQQIWLNSEYATNQAYSVALLSKPMLPAKTIAYQTP